MKTVIANLSGKLTHEDMCDLSRLLVKAGYAAVIRDKEVKSKKLKCVVFGGEDDVV
ncbi:hypothetical protein [Anaerosporobacter faecicola]|uniref:hypothetical protein n=1 Tax=Anaerosporobacter faecicola TaxID=2718714 RepID=UPI001439EF98|nr:hypothetical protein [Anaerosporobacter faecicola]